MKKIVLSSTLAFFLLSIIVGGIWYFHLQQDIETTERELFIPDNASLVFNFNSYPSRADENSQVYLDLLGVVSNKIIEVGDTLIARSLIDYKSRSFACRLDGPNQMASLGLFVFSDVMSKNAIEQVLSSLFSGYTKEQSDYESFKIVRYSLNERTYYYTLCGGILLVADSRYFIEDCIKQYGSGQGEEQEKISGSYNSVRRFLSSSAPMNLFMSNQFFEKIVPYFVRNKLAASSVFLKEPFKWGALDVEAFIEGVHVNGFMEAEGQCKSYWSTFARQKPESNDLFGQIPENATELQLLNLSDMDSYLKDLNTYRLKSGKKEKNDLRKNEFKRLYKEDVDVFVSYFQGHFAKVNLSKPSDACGWEGLVLASVSSTSLCTDVMERMAECNCNFTKEAKPSFTGTLDGEADVRYYRMIFPDLFAVLFGDVFVDMPINYVVFSDKLCIAGSSLADIQTYFRNKRENKSIKEAVWFKHLLPQLSSQQCYAYMSQGNVVYANQCKDSKKEWHDYLIRNKQHLGHFSGVALQMSQEQGMLYNSIFISSQKAPEVALVENRPIIKDTLLKQEKPAAVARKTPNMPKVVEEKRDSVSRGKKQAESDKKQPMDSGKVKVKNHVTGKTEYFYQDANDVIHLTDEKGKELWQRKITGKINSPVYQIDAFKNNKLQYLFSTAAGVYLIDRLGRDVSGFPIKLSAKCSKGVSVYDYDNDRNYRIFVPLENNTVALYNQKGAKIDGWNPSKTHSKLLSRVYFFRTNGKDYVLYADKSTLYILNRRGESRIPVPTLLDLDGEVTIHLTKDHSGWNVESTKKNYQVDFSGNCKVL